MTINNNVSQVLDKFCIGCLTLTCQHGRAYRADNLFTHVWCTGSLFPHGLFSFETFSHISIALACRIMSCPVKKQGDTLFSSMLPNDLRNLRYEWFYFWYIWYPKYRFFSQHCISTCCDIRIVYHASSISLCHLYRDKTTCWRIVNTPHQNGLKDKIRVFIFIENINGIDTIPQCL